MTDAIVVGSGPGGLSCAVALALEGVQVTVLEAEPTIGGGTRSATDLTAPGLLHDVCSAFHPMAAGSPAFRAFGLERYGLEWLYPDADCAHPLDDGTAPAMYRSLDATVAGLGEDGAAWRRVFGGPSRAFEALTDDILQPIVRVPSHPIHLARFGLGAVMPATVIAHRFKTQHARALFGGVAAHALAPLNRPLSASIGVALICACHAFGWPVARGGSQAIADALVAVLREHGGKVETGVRVNSLADLPRSDAVFLDMAPARVAEIAGDRLPPRVARAYRRYRHGPGAFKMDFAVEGGVPWTAEACRRAGTVHVGGPFEEIAAAEATVTAGRMPERPYVLLGQQYLADPGRSKGDVHPVWAYAHVPNGYDRDASDAVIGQIERFAPGFRERIVATSVQTPADLQAHNENYIGGDIVAGANTGLQILVRPRFALDPYATGIPGVYMCSAATPPGGGAHGMNGYNAAQIALRKMRG